MIKKRFILTIILLSLLLLLTACTGKNNEETQSSPQTDVIRMAVEYNTHAAPVFVAQETGELSAEGAFDAYATGVALSGALTQGRIDAAYICLIPAINAYANGNVPLKILCGTHKYGYGMVVDTSKIKTLQDLEKKEVKIGCVREGSTVDILLNKIIDLHGLDRQKVLSKVVRMNPAQQVIALFTGQVEAILVPEHFASLAAENGNYEMIIKGQDLWPDMQGSVLVVTEDFYINNPEKSEELYRITDRACRFINEHPREAAAIVADKLNVLKDTLEDIDLDQIAKGQDSLSATSAVIEQSMQNLDYTTAIDSDHIQQVINYVYELGYIKQAFPAEEIIAKR
ncbi:MAG: ABC transporter substrate-binding protein [Firmicutes bacterium]|nr:ABC transporter substrate-binding protein [Bacillota bacterium]